VHLTIGGCLGPCALANVAMLLFDGRSLWFHSVNDEAIVAAIFDYVEGMLDCGEFRMPDGPLAEHLFTGYQWEERPDRQPVDDPRAWRGRAWRPDATPSCELTEADLQVAVGTAEAPLLANGALHAMGPGAELPRSNGELVFGAPWEGRAFGMAASLADAGLFDWDAFRERLVAEIDANERSGEPFDYYANWLRALEATLAAEGVVAPGELVERTAEFEFGERAEVF
jgi:nitrile hydratase accessory protein